jgi:ribonuclease BN (tRNA processing enzyme)
MDISSPDGSFKLNRTLLRFNTKYKSVVFSGDTGPSEKLVNLANGADILVSEVGTVEDTVATFEKNGIWKNKTDAEKACFIKLIKEQHLTPQDVGEMAQKAVVKKVVLSHLAPTIYPNDKYERWKDLTKKYFSGEVVVAEDLMRIK